jgi:predicted DNA-binding transcriptional regulator AlpA
MSIQLITLPSGRLRPRLVKDRDGSRDQFTGSATFLSVKQTAGLLGISSVTLARWRIEGSGPPFCKFGRAVRYERAELLAWARSRARTSTSE